MTDKTKRCLRMILRRDADLPFRTIAVIALEELAQESGHLLCPDAVVALRKLIREFDEFDFEDGE